jgi:SAM-dependent methyltransferase
MVRTLKNLARTIAPAPVRAAWGLLYGDVKIRRARSAFDEQPDIGPAFLPAERLDLLIRRDYAAPPAVRYDAAGLVLRASEKIDQLSRVVDVASVRTALELGCWDGMVGAALAGRGVAAVCLDVTRNGIDARALAAGVRFLQSDAGAIALRDSSIDLVYSFGSLEHFPNPDRCLTDVARVLKRGGQVYLDFGPLYCSPYGRHAYRQIPVPFCHLLFAEDTLRGWARTAGLADDWPYVNGWTLKRYRRMWDALSSTFTVVQYREHTTGGVGTELITEYPACFRGRAETFDEFLVSAVEVVLQRR